MENRAELIADLERIKDIAKDINRALRNEFAGNAPGRAEAEREVLRLLEGTSKTLSLLLKMETHPVVMLDPDFGSYRPTKEPTQ